MQFAFLIATHEARQTGTQRDELRQTCRKTYTFELALEAVLCFEVDLQKQADREKQNIGKFM